jgi:hypothetical protein
MAHISMTKGITAASGPQITQMLQVNVTTSAPGLLLQISRSLYSRFK